VSGGASASFVYDGDGNRVKATFGDSTTVYVGSYYEQTGAGSTKYYYAGSQRIALRRSSYASDNGLFWLLTDHLGSTAITANSNGTRVAELRYKAWGETRYTYGATPTTYRFTGQRLDESTGLMYYGARYYDPALGRFVQADTIVPEPGNPQDLNRYAYVRNNPLNYTDPSGYIPCYGDPSLGECSWSGTGHHRVSQRGRRWDIAIYTNFVLREVRNPAAGVDDVEAFAQVMNFAAGFGTSTQEWANDISAVTLGAEGPFTLVTALPVALRQWLGGPHLPEFFDTGFHPAYQDGHNQPYHWWAYVNTTVQGGGAGAIFVGIPGNNAHEFLDFTESLKPPEERGASWQDYALSYNGMAFGLLLRDGTITPDNAADAARMALMTDIRDPMTRRLSQTGNAWLPPNVLGAGLDWLLGR